MEIFEKYNLKKDPFTLTPSINSDEIIWAGFPKIKSQIEKRIQRSIIVPSSDLVLNWGEYGSGKTHAARYFCKQNVLSYLAGKYAIPFAFNLVFPKGKEPIKEIFTQIIDKININELRKEIAERMSSDFKDEAIRNSTDNIFIQNIIRILLGSDKMGTSIEENLIKMYLFGGLDIKNFDKEDGINRKLSTDSDFIQFLSALFNVLTYKKHLHSCIILWFDELEDISTLTMSNISNVNNFFRTIMDKTPNNLLIFLNLTQSAMMTLSDIGSYLQEAVKSRITETINLPMPTKEEIMLYLKELLNSPLYRSAPNSVNVYFPFTEEVIEEIIQDVPNVSLRKYNLIFSNLLGNALFDDVSEIDKSYYESKKTDLPIF